jgi:hypothetical protein
MTYRYAAYSIQTTLKQNFDDADLSIQQIVFYLNVMINRLKYQHLKKDTTKTGAYLTIYDNVVVTPYQGYSYFTLPSHIYDLPHDKGISFIAYQRAKKGEWLTINFTRTTADRVWRLRKDAYEKPTSQNPYFYRVGDKVHLIAEDALNITRVVVGIYGAISSALQYNLDEEMPIIEEHVESLIYAVLNLARFSTVVTPDRDNDGSDTTDKINNLQKVLGYPLQQNQEQGNKQQEQE